MAEIILKVGDTPTYQDGDILCAFTDRHISCCHAQNICNPKHAGFKANGLRDIDSLTFKMFSEFYQYKFIRVSKTEVIRFGLQDASVETFSDKTEKQIHVGEYINRRINHPTHLIFGELGGEIWFGGRSDFSQSKIDSLWNHITEKTGKLKEAYNLWPCGTKDIIDHFAVKLDQGISEEIAIDLVTSDTESKEIDGEIVDVVIKKRKNYISWQDIPAISQLTINKIKNPSLAVDGRRKSEINLPSFIRTKS